MIYADIENGICVGIREVSGYESSDGGVELQDYDVGYLGRSYENGKWGEKQPIAYNGPEGEGVKVPADIVADLREKLDRNGEAIADLAQMILETGGAVK